MHLFGLEKPFPPIPTIRDFFLSFPVGRVKATGPAVWSVIDGGGAIGGGWARGPNPSSKAPNLGYRSLVDFPLHVSKVPQNQHPKLNSSMLLALSTLYSVPLIGFYLSK